MSRFSLLQSVQSTLDAWIVGLRALTFRENFRSFEWEGEIEAGVEKRITHNLRQIPSRWFLVSPQGTCLIIQSETPPSSDFLYVKNVASTSTFKGKIVIMP